MHHQLALKGADLVVRRWLQCHVLNSTPPSDFFATFPQVAAVLQILRTSVLQNLHTARFVKSANRSLLPIGPDFGNAGRACFRMAPDTRRSQIVKYCDSSCVTKTKKRYSFRDDRT